MILMEDYLGSYTRAVDWPKGRTATYQEASQRAFAQSIYYGDSYLVAFARAGLDACQVVPMRRPLQALWAREHGIRVLPGILDERPARWAWTRRGQARPGHTLLRDVLDAQIREVRPDILWVFSGVPVAADQIKSWRASARKVILWWSCAINTDMPYDSFDLILSGIPMLVDDFRAMGLEAEYLPHAFDRRVLYRVGTADPRLQRVLFAGRLSDAQQERIGSSTIFPAT